MTIKVTHSYGITEIELKNIYTEEMLIEALDSGVCIALTKADDKTYILQPINVVSIEVL